MGYKKRIPAAMVDFNFNINLLFPQEISSVRNDLIPSGFQGGSGNAAVVRRQVATVLDVLGEQSARAQGLKNPITSGNKMLNAEDQAAYILVDRFGNNGMGSVVGLLKVGRKKLFLLDEVGKHNEMVPQCVLDFYVVENRQRSGCGKRLFEFMLRSEAVDPRYLAVDRPSPKLIAFLQKHYGLVRTIPQINNYVIFSGFFKNQPQVESPLAPKKARIYMGKLQFV
eukprot:TRINITY_DN10953_c0_g1_i1.p1 TRINITY_DN10953_c0_g1~~TRINITY_DN10953_c0_g1_i1.p1  ORF type:complete len:251 (-),score=76.92 TRINITY_DN10953_c0_g1_i1:108-782(-)